MLQAEEMEGRNFFFYEGCSFQKRDPILEVYFFRVCSGSYTNESCNDMEMHLP